MRPHRKLLWAITGMALFLALIAVGYGFIQKVPPGARIVSRSEAEQVNGSITWIGCSQSEYGDFCSATCGGYTGGVPIKGSDPSDTNSYCVYKDWCTTAQLCKEPRIDKTMLCSGN